MRKNSLFFLEGDWGAPQKFERGKKAFERPSFYPFQTQHLANLLVNGYPDAKLAGIKTYVLWVVFTRKFLGFVVYS